jgi:hypothetical protein
MESTWNHLMNSCNALPHYYVKFKLNRELYPLKSLIFPLKVGKLFDNN